MRRNQGHHGSVAYPLTTDDLTVLIERDTESLDQYADLSETGIRPASRYGPANKFPCQGCLPCRCR